MFYNLWCIHPVDVHEVSIRTRSMGNIICFLYITFGRVCSWWFISIACRMQVKCVNGKWEHVLLNHDSCRPHMWHIWDTWTHVTHIRHISIACRMHVECVNESWARVMSQWWWVTNCDESMVMCDQVWWVTNSEESWTVMGQSWWVTKSDESIAMIHR